MNRNCQHRIVLFVALVGMGLVCGAVGAVSAQETTDVGFVSGTVTDDSVTPIEGAEVTLTDDSGSIVATDATNSDGEFAVEIPAGEYEATASASGYHSTKTVIAVDNAQSEHVNLYLEEIVDTGELAGDVVTENMEIVPDAEVTLSDAETGETVATTTSGPQGSYVFVDIEHGDYQIEAVADSMSGFATATVIDGTTNQDIVVSSETSTGAVTGDVVTESGNALPDAEVTLYDAETDETVSTTITDSDGIYVFDEVEHGEYRIEAVVDAESGFATATVTDGTTSQDIVVPGVTSPTATGELIGDVVTENDNALAGAEVILSDAETAETVATTITDSDGSYVFDEIEHGEYQIEAVVDSESGFATATVTDGTTTQPIVVSDTNTDGQITSDTEVVIGDSTELVFTPTSSENSLFVSGDVAGWTVEKMSPNNAFTSPSDLPTESTTNDNWGTIGSYSNNEWRVTVSPPDGADVDQQYDFSVDEEDGQGEQVASDSFTITVVSPDGDDADEGEDNGVPDPYEGDLISDAEVDPGKSVELSFTPNNNNHQLFVSGDVSGWTVEQMTPDSTFTSPSSLPVTSVPGDNWATIGAYSDGSWNVTVSPPDTAEPGESYDFEVVELDGQNNEIAKEPFEIKITEAAPVPDWVDDSSISADQYRAFDTAETGSLNGAEIQAGVSMYIESLPNGKVNDVDFDGTDIRTLVEGYINNEIEVP